MGDQNNRLGFSWWPSSGIDRDRCEFPILIGVGLVTRKVIWYFWSSS